MVYVRSRKFCCCLPVRFGVFVMAILGIVGGGIVSAAGWVQINGLSKHPLEKRDKTALILQTIMYTVLAVVSLFGLIGTFNKKRSLISLYSTILFSHLGFSIITGAFFLYTLFHQTGTTDVDRCVNGSTESSKKEACETGFQVIRGIIVGLFVFIWLLELYGCVIVANYVEQLDEEEALAYSKTVAAPITTYTNNFAPGYAFAAPNQSHGVHANGNNV